MSLNSIVTPAIRQTALTAADWNRRYENSADLIWSADGNRFVTEECRAMTPGTALDLAAGEGRNAVWLAERGWSVHMVDFSVVGLRKAGHLAINRGVSSHLKAELADLCNYLPEPARYDLVLLAYLQLPREQMKPILRRAAMAVAPGGTLLLVGHDSSNLLSGFGGPQNAEVLYTPPQVVACLEDQLDVEKAAVVERKVQAPDGPRIALDCLVRARRRA